VHAPQEVVSQPMLVAVRPAVSRRKSREQCPVLDVGRYRGAFTINVTFTRCLSPR